MKNETTHTPERKPKRRPDWLTVLAAACGGTMFGMLVMFTTVLPAEAEAPSVQIGEPVTIEQPATTIAPAVVIRDGFTVRADSIGEALAKGMNKSLGGQEGEPYVSDEVTP